MEQNQKTQAYTTPRADISAMVPPNAASILDVGCSNGALGRSLKQAKQGREVSGIELDADFAAEARNYLRLVINADLNSMNWEEQLQGQTFDCIIFADVLEHLTDPVKCLSNARKHLAVGGCVIVSLPNIRHVSALASIFISGVFPRKDRGIFDRTHLRWFTLTDARALLHETGFAVCDADFALRWGDRGGGIFNRVLNRLPTQLKKWAPIREFFCYQVCLRAEAR